MNRYVLGVEYDGSNFAGWQWQTARRTVQAEVENALSKVANEPIRLICAGRTDAGVHALEQVVHFDTTAKRDSHAWLMGSNSELPNDVRILWVKEAVDDFHARYSAVARFYRYIILNRKMKSALQPTQTTWCYEPLDADKMQQAAQYLIGTHDFSTYRAQGCQSKSPTRMIHFIDVYRQGEQVIMDISANAFLHHMVRNIAGVLMDVGSGKRPLDWPKQLLEIKDRSQGGITAKPHGLYLGSVFYPEKYGISKHSVFAKLQKDIKRHEWATDKVKQHL